MISHSHSLRYFRYLDALNRQLSAAISLRGTDIYPDGFTPNEISWFRRQLKGA